MHFKVLNAKFSVVSNGSLARLFKQESHSHIGRTICCTKQIPLDKHVSQYSHSRQSPDYLGSKTLLARLVSKTEHRCNNSAVLLLQLVKDNPPQHRIVIISISSGCTVCFLAEIRMRSVASKDRHCPSCQ